MSNYPKEEILAGAIVIIAWQDQCYVKQYQCKFVFTFLIKRCQQNFEIANLLSLGLAIVFILAIKFNIHRNTSYKHLCGLL